MKDVLKIAIEEIWGTAKASEDAAWGLLRRKFPTANRTQFHDAYLEVQSAHMTPEEKFGKDVKKVAEASRLSEPASTNTPGDVVKEPPAPTLGEGSPTSPGAAHEEAVEGIGSRPDQPEHVHE